MATVIEQAIVAMREALAGMPGLVSIERDRPDPAHAEEMPCVSLRRGDSDHSPLADGLDVALALVDLDVYAAGDDASTHADDLHQHAHELLASDPDLARLVREIRCLSTEWQSERRDVLVGRLTCRYQLRLVMQASSLTRAFY